MVNSMLDGAEYSRWIGSSRRTLDSAKGDLDRGDYNWVCFKVQQAAEFAVKALLRGLGVHAYGHSVSKLLTEAPKDLKLERELIQAAKTLDKYYVPTRYPNSWVEGSPEDYYTREDAEKALEYAKEIIEWVETLWKSLKKGEV